MVSGVGRTPTSDSVFLGFDRNSDVHWFNTVKISRSAIESSLGPSRVDSRARNFFILGASLSALFDIAQAPDFLKALLKLLEEWESLTEGNTGNKGVVSPSVPVYKPVLRGVCE